MDHEDNKNEKYEKKSRKRPSGPQPATFEYKELGTVAVDQLAHALWEDIRALKDFYGISFVTGAKLIIPATNGYGDPVTIKHPDGRTMTRIATHAHTPACYDYKL